MAVAVNGSVPAGAAADTVKSTSTDPPVAGNGADAGAAVTFGIAGIASVVAAFHPFRAVIVNVIFPVAPGVSVSVGGLAVSVKSGGGGTTMFSVTVRVPGTPAAEPLITTGIVPGAAFAATVKTTSCGRPTPTGKDAGFAVTLWIAGIVTFAVPVNPFSGVSEIVTVPDWL